MVATLARFCGDLDLAEESAADAFAVAVERWPAEGEPDNPGAWLVTVGRNKALDRIRREARRGPRLSAAQETLDMSERESDGLADSGLLGDDRLRLIFTCCHPALTPEARIALTLRLVGGLTTAEVARGFMVTEATMAQRLVRAKRKIAAERIPYRIPEAHELPDRMAGVLKVVYLVFREGYSPSAGEDVVRVDLCDEAIRLGRLIFELLPDEGEAQGLLGLMLLHHSRRQARHDDAGDLVLLADQDRRAWDHDAIREGAALAARAMRRARLPYALQASIAACHAAAPSAAEVDWRAIAALYGELLALDASPAVALNRAVAVAEAEGAAAGLDLVDELLAAQGESLRRTHQPHVVRADLLRRLGRMDEAAAACRRAIDLAPTRPERRFLGARLAELTGRRPEESGTGVT